MVRYRRACNLPTRTTTLKLLQRKVGATARTPVQAMAENVHDRAWLGETGGTQVFSGAVLNLPWTRIEQEFSQIEADHMNIESSH